MNNSTARANPWPRWLLSIALASSAIGVAAPSILHGQAAPGPDAARFAKQATGARPAPGAAPQSPSGPPAGGHAPQVAPTPAPPPTPAAAEALQLSRAFTEVAERVLPSVVSIRVEAEARPEDYMIPGLPFIVPGPGMNGRGPMPQVRGHGSGVVIRSDGVILTNNHVVERARRLDVRLADGRTMRARVLGRDPASDLALIQIPVEGLQPARLADSDQARVGEWVLAIGAPLGLEATVTHGILSATGRGGIGAAEIEDYLQTDASINPGNSGGPLVNLRGEVLGINTMIVGRGTGIGMAVPSRLAQSVAEQVLRDGRVSRPWVGVGVQNLSSDLSQALQTPGLRGALVNDVRPTGPAARSGLQVGDVITAVDNRPVTSSHEVVRAISRRRVGEQVAFTVLRGGRPQAVNVTTAERPGANDDASPLEGAARGGGPSSGPERPRASARRTVGIRVAVLPPEITARLGMPAGVVAVAEVEPGSAGDSAGLRHGDIVLRADGREVRSAEDLRNATRDGHAVLLIRRGQQQAFIPVNVD